MIYSNLKLQTIQKLKLLRIIKLASVPSMVASDNITKNINVHFRVTLAVYCGVSVRHSGMLITINKLNLYIM